MAARFAQTNLDLLEQQAADLDDFIVVSDVGGLHVDGEDLHGVSGM